MLLIAWILPWNLELGALRLSPYRIVLIITILPSLVQWLSGKAGRVRMADVAMLLFSLWGLLSLTVLHGPQVGLQTGGILFLETMGSYLVARCYIRNADDFYGLVRVLFWLVVSLLPFAIIEAVTGQKILLQIFGTVLPVHQVIATEPRWGFTRVQAVFDHPILMGVCCGSILALTHLVLGRDQPTGRRWLATATVAVTAGLSFSSGPWSAMVIQILLMAWNWVLRDFKPRWKIMIASFALACLSIQLFAKRPLPDILFSAFAFEPQSAFFRLLIWDYGTQSVANHPWFGVGNGEWDRPSWMPPSIDMFWLYNAIIYGLPAGILMLAAFLFAVISVSLLKDISDKLYQYRAAYLMAMTALFQMGWMVHFWNSTYVLFLLLLGSGLWLLDAPRDEQLQTEEPRTNRRRGVVHARPRVARQRRQAAELVDIEKD